jgi:hypothetical protein
MSNVQYALERHIHLTKAAFDGILCVPREPSTASSTSFARTTHHAMRASVVKPSLQRDYLFLESIYWRMNQTIGPSIELRVSDLVLDPFRYQDALSRQARSGQLQGATIKHLAAVLPQAVAQLDAIGDTYGSLALTKLYDQLAGFQTAV